MELCIPGGPTLPLSHAVLDFNGTLALDGMLSPVTRRLMGELAGRLAVHVVTADTFGSACGALAGVPCELHVLPCGAQDEAKLRYVEALGTERCVCVGNGRNDRLMLRAAALAIVVIGGEGAAIESLMAADLAVADGDKALELLLHPRRIAATLRR